MNAGQSVLDDARLEPAATGFANSASVDRVFLRFPLQVRMHVRYHATNAGESDLEGRAVLGAQWRHGIATPTNQARA